MSMYNLIKYSDSHSKTSGSWSQYYKGDLNANLADYESFISKIKIGGCTSNDDNTKIVYIAVPLKYLSKFWRTVEMPQTNSEINLILKWSPTCVITNSIRAGTITY